MAGNKNYLRRKGRHSSSFRISEFQSFFKDNENGPATQNLYAVNFATPRCLRSGRYLLYGKYDLEVRDENKILNYYADSVNLPSKQVTTGQIKNVGAAYNYATTSTFSQISITFRMPRSHKTRMIFEKWIQIMSSDSNQMTDYYDDYTAPHLYIFKYERGGGKIFDLTEETKRFYKKNGIPLPKKADFFKDHQLVGVYDMENVFPYNIGSMNLNNQQAQTITLDVGFYYERYRFYGKQILDDDGRAFYFNTGASDDSPLPIPGQSINDPNPATRTRNKEAEGNLKTNSSQSGGQLMSGTTLGTSGGIA